VVENNLLGAFYAIPMWAIVAVLALIGVAVTWAILRRR
jgi:hypothetical protein